MKQLITCLLAMLGLTACGQEKFETTDVTRFETLTNESNVVVLDVRTAEEFAEGHLLGAINIDQKQDNFIEKVKATLPNSKIIAIYCRSGRRSASAANRLTEQGYTCVNLGGGIIAWKEAGKAVTTDNFEVDVFKTTSGKVVKFHALVHASIRIEYDGQEIVVDPVRKLGNRTIDYTSMPKANYLLVTHEHGDHFDREALKQLSSDNTLLVMNKRCSDLYGAGEIMANGDSKQLSKDITLEAVPAYNTTEGHQQFHPKGRDNGYILTVDGLRIYIAGDTEDIPEMANIKDIDIAFLPCNQPYTMTTNQLIRAAKIIKPKVLFPYHYSKTDVSGIPALLKEENIDVRIRHYE